MCSGGVQGVCSKPQPLAESGMASEPHNGFNCTNECSGHSLKFPPKGVDCCLGAVLAIAVLGAEEIPAGSEPPTPCWKSEVSLFRRINNNIKTGLFFGWKVQVFVCL